MCLFLHECYSLNNLPNCLCCLCTAANCDQEKEIFRSCSGIEDVRRRNSNAYEIIQVLMEWVAKHEDKDQSITAVADFLSRPNLLAVDAGFISFVVVNRDRFFVKPSFNDAHNSRCQPDGKRQKEREKNRITSAIRDA